MAEQRKYMFDMDFTPGAKKTPMGGNAMGAPKEPEPPPPAVMFTEEELGMARDGAFEEGRNVGYAAGLQAGETHLAQALDMLIQSLPLLAQAQAEANQQILAESIKLVLATTQRAFPAMAATHAFEEVSKVVADLVPHLLDEPRIIVRVSQPLVENMRVRLEAVGQATGFEGRMVVQEDARLGPSDCKVEWADGGAERDLARLIDEMKQVVDRALASVSDTAVGTQTQAKETVL